MQLLAYLPTDGAKRKGALEDLASKVFTSCAYLYLVALGHKRCGHEIAKRIEDATDGAVTRYDLRPDIFGDPPTPITVVTPKPKPPKTGGAKARVPEKEAE